VVLGATRRPRVSSLSPYTTLFRSGTFIPDPVGMVGVVFRYCELRNIDEFAPFIIAVTALILARDPAAALFDGYFRLGAFGNGLLHRCCPFDIDGKRFTGRKIEQGYYAVKLPITLAINAFSREYARSTFRG